MPENDFIVIDTRNYYNTIMNSLKLRAVKILMVPISFLRKCYRYFVRPRSHGVRAIITNSENEVLLVKHTYYEEWYLPGGGIELKETPDNALKRELSEEIGITNIKHIELFGVYTNYYEYKFDLIVVFHINEFEIYKTTNIEIEDFRYFSQDNIPKNTSRGTRRRLNEYYNNFTKDNVW